MSRSNRVAFAKAQQLMPGCANSPPGARAAGGEPIFIDRAKAWLTTSTAIATSTTSAPGTDDPGHGHPAVPLP